MKVAAIDAGTNTLRLLISELYNGKARTLARMRKITGLGGGVASTGEFGFREMESSLSAFESFAQKMRRAGVSRYVAAGTQAFRESENVEGFVRRAKERSGINIRIISPKEEAELTYRGIESVLGLEHLGSSIVVDVGGGSTELMRGKPGKGRWLSTRLGVVYLNSICSPSDPPAKWELDHMMMFVNDRLHATRKILGKKKASYIIGTAGTFTTLGAICLGLKKYDPEAINGLEMKREEVERLSLEILSMPSNKRLKIPGMEKGREKLIVPGLLIARAVMDFYGANRLVISDGGLLEGITDAIMKKNIQGDEYEPRRH